jgi:hypothetical protein
MLGPSAAVLRSCRRSETPLATYLERPFLLRSPPRPRWPTSVPLLERPPCKPSLRPAVLRSTVVDATSRPRRQQRFPGRNFRAPNVSGRSPNKLGGLPLMAQGPPGSSNLIAPASVGVVHPTHPSPTPRIPRWSDPPPTTSLIRRLLARSVSRADENARPRPGESNQLWPARPLTLAMPRVVRRSYFF